jgi:4-hydroxythreonine-4-phosphate dehydrogenase
MRRRESPHLSLPIGITQGDPSGIGPELIAKLFNDGDLGAPAVVIGDRGIMERAARIVGAQLLIRGIGHPREALQKPGVIDVICETQLPADLEFGTVSKAAGGAAYRYVERAVGYALEGSLRAIVTAPLNKAAMAAAGFDFPGHTEILAAKSGTQDFAMMLSNGELRVLLVTIHMSLASAIAKITEAAEVRAIRLAHSAVRRYGIARPRVAVAGLNPHAGENGMFGREDIDIIAPAIARARAEGIDATGPWPGDTVFMRARRGEFDIVVAQYHDQGLIPVKLLGVERGVNITVGLPFVRTSVDHGTAFDIAGTGTADPTSLRHAFAEAVALTREPPLASFALAGTRART